MPTPQEKKQGKALYSGNVAAASVSTPMPSVSTPTIPAANLRGTSYTQTSDNTSSTFGCSSAYLCGQQNLEVMQRLENVEARLTQVEETSAEKRSCLKRAESLLLVFKVVLIACPVVLFIALAIVQYFCYKDSTLLNVVSGVIGVAAVVECILLPILWKSVELRVEKIEEQLRK